MRKNPTKKIEQYRVTEGEYGSTSAEGRNGAFILPGPNGATLRLIVSDGSFWKESGMGDGEPWEHVSVSLASRCPTWDEMAFVKRIFWRDDEAVMQLHPPQEQYVNFHAFCLHLWKPHFSTIPLPPMLAVGPKI